ncbi:MAG: polyhydroxyalkanoate synthesis repressor PhaR [Litorivicinus sp.]
MRVIKKYPNRRLYDTSKSTYITLDDVKTLVLNLDRFKVVDSKTEEDLTRSILLQIIMEQEGDDGGSVMTNEVLQSLIRFYGQPLRGEMSKYLDSSVKVFLEQQDTIQEQMQRLADISPVNMMTKMAEQNMNMWLGLGKKTKD